KNTLSYVHKISGINSLIIWDTFHYCFISQIGNSNIILNKDMKNYCDKYIGKIPNFYANLLNIFMDYFLGEPLKYGANYSFQNPNLKSNQNYLYTFHQE